MKKIFLSISLLLAGLCSCTTNQTAQQAGLTLSGLNPANFETTADGTKPVKLYTLKNKSGMEVCITNFGGRIVSIMVPDKHGKMTDVVLGFDSIADYMKLRNDFGASIGRYANRINQGKIVLEGREIQLSKNSSGHSLHGGPKGWQYQVFEASQKNDSTLLLTMNSADGDNNFPGNVTAHVTYTLTSDNSIDIQYDATTDKTTIINLTNHSYFNLNGDPSKPATDNILYIAADSITPIDSTFITTGEMMAVTGTQFDFNTPTTIAPRVSQFENEQLKFGNGFDHNWVLRTKGDISKLAAKVTSPATGISLEVYTNEPGLQVYTGNFLNGKVKGKKGIAYPQRAAVCLETQHYPDSPNKPQWPSPLLKVGETYHSRCIYKFSCEK